MSVEGLRAWVAEVERKLGKRTRVFLALSVIAIGIAGAAVYLAIDARESSVSESDVRALQEKLETRIEEAGGATTTLPEVETTPTPAPESTPGGQEGGKQGTGGGSGNGANGGGSSKSGGGSAQTPGATGGAGSSAKLKELLQQAKERSEENE